MWIVTVDGVAVESDDFTVEELGEIERITGDPWSVVNPLRAMKTAKAFIAVALAHQGLDEAAVADRLERLTLRDMKRAFRFVLDDEEGVVSGGIPLDRQRKTSRASSRGAQGKGGHRARLEGSA